MGIDGVDQESIQTQERDVIPRYTRKEMGEIWTDRNRLQIWMEVELTAAEAMAEIGLIPPEVASYLRGRPSA